MSSEFIEPMNCREVKLFIPLFVLGGRGMMLDERITVEDHIQSCPDCARQYRQTRFVVDLVQGQRDDLIRKGVFSAPVPEDIGKELTDEDSLQEIWDKVERSKARQNRNRTVRHVKIFVKASVAAAACLVIGLSVWLTLSNSSQPAKPTQQPAIVASRPFVTVELLSDKGKVQITAGMPIRTSADERRTLIINGKHLMMMNTDTILSVEPLADNGQIGCMVKLASGEIFTHVEDDGKPFVVETSHGKAVITGTTFDVKATDSSTTLVVTEGRVQFESEKGTVEVAAGQTSRIVGWSAPTKPAVCDTAELTAWATGPEVETPLARIKSAADTYDLDGLWLTAVSGPTNLEAIDYNDWVEEKRDWFKREFPWIFQLKDALAKEGVNADYPELLIRSGDVWQFVYPEVSPNRISVLEADLLLRTAFHYGFGEKWLLKNVPAFESAIDNPMAVKERVTGLKAFEKWMGCLEGTRKSPRELEPGILLYSLHAGTYLADTKTLVWLAIRNGQGLFRPEDETKVLALLQGQVNAAYSCKQSVIELFGTDWQGQDCDKYQELLSKVIEYIKVITSIEKKISECRAKLERR